MKVEEKGHEENKLHRLQTEGEEKKNTHKHTDRENTFGMRGPTDLFSRKWISKEPAAWMCTNECVRLLGLSEGNQTRQVLRSCQIAAESMHLIWSVCFNGFTADGADCKWSALTHTHTQMQPTEDVWYGIQPIT